LRDHGNLQIREDLADLAQFAGVVARQYDVFCHSETENFTGLTGLKQD
jgi:hypothetical protein